MKKILLLIASLITSPIISFIGIITIGTLIGNAINPTNHNHYECVCDQPPTISTLQAIISRVIFFAIIETGLHFILQSLKLSPKERTVAFIILFIANTLACIIAIDILSSPISG